MPALLTLAFFSGCAYITGEAPKAPTPQLFVKSVSPVQSSALIQQNSGNSRFVILDVRTPLEYADGHLPGAVNIDFDSPTFKDAVSHLDENRTYLVYCRTGARSATASKIMVELGFRHIYNMTGGFTEWQAQGFPVVK